MVFLLPRIELTQTMSIARIIQDLRKFFSNERTSAEVVYFFEHALEYGYDTFLISCEQMALELLDDVFLQRPYLQQQIKLCVELSQNIEGVQFTHTSWEQLQQRRMYVEEQLGTPNIAIGFINGNDPCFDPLSISTGMNELFDAHFIHSIGMTDVTMTQLQAINLFSEQPVSFFLLPWSRELLVDCEFQAHISLQQVMPLFQMPLKIPKEVFQKEPNRVSMGEISIESMTLAFLFMHPLHMSLLIQPESAIAYHQAFQEMIHHDFEMIEWYQYL